MRHNLEFNESASKEWKKLPAELREQLRKKLRERLSNPHVPAARLHTLSHCYKIKLAAAGYRLVYEVDDRRKVVIVVSVGKRDGNRVYQVAKRRLSPPR